MRVLLDEQIPVDSAAALQGHSVDTVVRRGWAGLKNGDPLRRAASNRMVHLRPLARAILDALPLLKPGELLRIGA